MTEMIEVYPLAGGKPSSRVAVPEGLAVLADGQGVPPGYGCFRVLTAADGDKRVVWRADSLREIHEARQMFNELVASGLVPYRVGADGRATVEVMLEFDAGAGEVVFLPVRAAVGG